MKPITNPINQLSGWKDPNYPGWVWESNGRFYSWVQIATAEELASVTALTLDNGTVTISDEEDVVGVLTAPMTISEQWFRCYSHS